MNCCRGTTVPPDATPSPDAYRENEERQAFLLQLSDAVRPLADPGDVQGEATRRLRSELSAGWCYYVNWEFHRRIGLVLRDSAREGLPSLSGTHDVSDAPEFLQLLAEGDVLNVPDYASYEKLPQRIRRNFEASGFRSMMVAPLVKNGRLIASLIVGDTDVRSWSDNETSLLIDVAERTWAAIERARAEAEQRVLSERQLVLVAELQHRTRNILAVVRSLADRTVRASAGLDDFRDRFRDRLNALVRVQGLLSRLHEHDRVTFDELIETELDALACGDGRVRLNGPKGVRLRSSMVQTLAMALHELATNAIKYGALAQAGGQLDVIWHVSREDSVDKARLHIDWRESGVQMPPNGSQPSGGGQGRELIEKALPYQLRAQTTYQIGTRGVHCTITIPVSTMPERGADNA
jgi:two-component sensor histidine kinase